MLTSSITCTPRSMIAAAPPENPLDENAKKVGVFTVVSGACILASGGVGTPACLVAGMVAAFTKNWFK